MAHVKSAQRDHLSDGSPPVLDGETLPRLHPAARLEQKHPGRRERWVIPPSPFGWTGDVVGEWELAGAGCEDIHPNLQTNYVLDGELYVESGGVTVIARKGDVVQVPGGSAAKYWAPRRARMVAFRGPNPTGTGVEIERHWILRPAPRGRHPRRHAGR